MVVRHGQGNRCGDFPGGPVAKTLSSQCRGLGLIPGQGTKIPQAATKSPHADKTKDPVCCNKDMALSNK